MYNENIIILRVNLCVVMFLFIYFQLDRCLLVRFRFSGQWYPEQDWL